MNLCNPHGNDDLTYLVVTLLDRYRWDTWEHMSVQKLEVQHYWVITCRKADSEDGKCIEEELVLW